MTSLIAHLSTKQCPQYVLCLKTESDPVGPSTFNVSGEGFKMLVMGAFQQVSRISHRDDGGPKILLFLHPP